MHYRLSPIGRRSALALLLGAICVWVFAFWALQSTLGTVAGEEGLGFFAALQRNLAAGLPLSQLIPALLMIALIFATPLVFWSILEEYAAVYTIADTGLRYESIGISLVIPWDAIEELVARAEGNEINYELRLNRDLSVQIRNPLLRFLHRQSAGRRQLQLPAGIEHQSDLVAAISTLEANSKHEQQVEQTDDPSTKPGGASSRA